MDGRDHSFLSRVSQRGGALISRLRMRMKHPYCLRMINNNDAATSVVVLRLCMLTFLKAWRLHKSRHLRVSLYMGPFIDVVIGSATHGYCSHFYGCQKLLSGRASVHYFIEERRINTSLYSQGQYVPYQKWGCLTIASPSLSQIDSLHS